MILGAAGVVGLMLAHSQETAGSGTVASGDSVVAVAADSQSLPQITAAAAPSRGGTYWWVLPGGQAVPTPVLPLDLTAPIYEITPDEFLVDLTGGTVMVTRFQLAAQAQTANAYAAAVTAQVQGLIDIITMVQTPTPMVTAGSMALRARPMDDGGGGFTPDYSTTNGPYLTIGPTGTNGLFLITVFNNTSPANYEIWYTPILANAAYPWTAVAAGTAGQTNFVVSAGSYYTGFYQAIWDTNSIPLWEAANPNNPDAGILTVYIDSPTNGAVLQ